ncbi:MAG: ParB/RepB/Spo0J family partition protein [SAR324 cluster bacterium]|nr:ParB/RepB/Spo0J family partition protein [SAR324 cluster bacterium]
MGRPKQTMRQLQRISPLEISMASEDAALPAESVEGLARSMKTKGQREPVLITPHNGNRSGGAPGYRLVQGSKRLLAARLLKWPEMDCIVLEPEYAEEIRVIQRIRDEGFEPWQLADTLHRLKSECGWSQAQLGMAIGKSRDFVANILAIANIAPEVRSHILEHRDEYRLTARHLRYIGRTAPARQLALAREMLANRISTKTLQERRKELPSSRRFHLKAGRPKRSGSGKEPGTIMEWRKVYRKTTTELKRLAKQEAEAMSRIGRVIQEARVRKRLVKTEAKEKRRLLLREQRRAARKLAVAGHI